MKLHLFVALFFASFFVPNLEAQVYPADFSQVQVANGLTNPTFISFSPDGRIFVSEQGGTLRIIKNGMLLAAPFLTVTVNSSGERGLLGVAFDPDFTTNNFLYVYYTAATPVIHNRISRFTANGDLVLAGSEVPILDLDPLGATNHNGGSMAFGPDGKLYVGVGENAVGANAQNTNTYLGKILRINSDGTAPADNPVTIGSAQEMRTWALGLRNPFTITFDPLSGKLFVNDVGENTTEEINDATTGGNNYGWNIAEGTSNNPAFTNPIHTYLHTGGGESGCAITGGTFFNPTATNYPAMYMGNYFYIDLCSNWMYRLSFSGTTATATNFATGIAGSPVSLVTGNDGNLYFISRADNAVYKIIYTGVLPLELLRFTAELNMSQHAALSWETSRETNTAYFVVEKSTGDNLFLSIDTVQAVNDPTITHTYHATDTSACKANCFYRLKMFDLDGKFSYSSIVRIRVNNSNRPMVYPNPAKAFINIVQGTEPVKFVSVYDISGRAVIRFNNKGSENNFQISTGNLSKGVYQVEMTTSNHVYVEKVLIE